MKYTEDYPHRPILGKAGEFVDILSRVPADTDIVLDVATYFSRDIAPSALEISIGNYRPFEHIIHIKDDGTLENTLKVNIRAEWNRDENMAEGEIFAALFYALREVLHKRGQYDTRKLPKENSIAKTAANNPCAFFDMLNEFQKKYRGKKENHKEDGKVDKGNG